MEREGEGVLSSAEVPAGYPPYGTKRPLRRKEGKGGNERMIDLRLISNLSHQDGVTSAYLRRTHLT